MNKQRRLDPEKTRESILCAAQALFVKNGYSGTSMRDIARDAGVSQSMISHHFGSKQALWEKVKFSSFSQYLGQLDSCDLQYGCGEHSLAQKLAKILSQRFHFFIDHPDLIRLITWSGLEQIDKDIPKEGVEHIMALTQLIKDGQKEGEVRDDIDPIQIVLFIFMSTRAWFQGNVNWMLKIFDQGKQDDRQNLEAYLDAVIKILGQGILKS